MDYDAAVADRNSLWLKEQLGQYCKKYSPDGGRTVPHIVCAGYMRNYTSSRFFTRRRVEMGSGPTTEEWIERRFSKEPEDEALGSLREIYRQLKRMTPEPKPEDEFL